MTSDQRDIRRKLRVLRHAEANGSVVRTCRYFGVGRASFYRWKTAYKTKGEAGLINGKTIPKWHANRTPLEIEEKVLHLRRKYHLGPIRIMWYLERYHSIKISDACYLQDFMPAQHEPAATRNTDPQGSYQAVSETSSGPSHSDGR